jgi:sugar phosphate isomerase/epimerase
VHLSDVKNVPREKATNEDRTFPGEGIMPLTHIVTSLTRRGYMGAFSVEILGECQRADPLKVAKESYRCAHKLLGTSGPSHRKLAL